MKSSLYVVLGLICVVLGSFGLFIPGLPTTPFILLAAWLFVRSSSKLYNILLNSIFGKYIRKYEENKGMTKKSKIISIIMMTIMVTISIILIDPLYLKIIVAILAFIGANVVWFLVPNSIHDK